MKDVKDAVQAGCRVIQFRDKDKTTRVMIEEAKEMKRLCESDTSLQINDIDVSVSVDKATFLINDRIDVAVAVDADGVHIGQDDIPFDTARVLLGGEKIIGLTVHNVEEALEAERLGADYVGLSPIFATDTKSDAGAACGLEMIQKVREAISIPIVAVGGINMENVEEVIRAGADSAAAISAVLASKNITQSTREIIDLIKKAKTA
jgi:thiamine-phosphate pyrophosphorylase